MTGEKALWARPACDPGLPERLRLLVTQPRTRSRPRRWLQDRELGRHPGQVIFPHDLLRTGRLLLARAQRAIDLIASSDVRAAGLLEADESALWRHEWEIACAMRDLAKVRALTPGGGGGADPDAGAMSAAVAGAHQRAVALAEEATGSRVSALERYAGQVAAADDAHRDWHSALRLAGLNDQYLDLVARTAADEHAVAELGELADRAAVIVRVLRESLRDATAAEVLAMPPVKAS